MDKPQRKILRSPSVKRRSKALPVGQRVTLERVLGLTVSSNAAFACDPITGVIAYPAGCVVVLFNPRRNRQSHIFNVSKKTITSLAFSPDGKHLVTGESGHQPAVRVWDVEDKSQVAEFHGHKFGINCVAFFPNQKHLVSVGSQHDMIVNVWNWRTGNKLASNKVAAKVSAIAFGADSSFFVTVGNRHVKFWYLDSSKVKINQTVPLLGRSGILGDQKNNYFCGVVCGRGERSGSTYIITRSGLLCEFNDKRLLDKWVELRTKCANCISAGEDHIYIGCAEGVVRVFSAGTLQFVATLPYPHHLGVDVATATSSSDMICTESDAKYPDVIAVTLDDRHKKVGCVYADHSLYLWDVVSVHRVGKAASFLFHSACVWALEVYPSQDSDQTGPLPPGTFLTASSDNTIRAWNLDSQMIPTPGYTRNIYSSELLKVVYPDPSNTFLCDVDYNPAGATDKTDTTWDGKNGIRSIRVSPDGQHLASGDRQGNIRIYDLHGMSEVRCIEAHESDVVCLEYSFSKTGPKILASGSRDRLIHVFDVEQHYGLLQTLDDHSAAIQSVRFTHANNTLRMLSCGSDKSLLFRNASLSPDFEFVLNQHLVSKSTMYDMIIDPTHQFVTTACQDRNIRIYNMETAKQKKNYRGALGDEGTLLRVELDPSGTYAATSCTDKNLCLLDFYTGELAATVFGHSEIVTGLRFSNDLKHLISVSADGCIFVWRLSSEMTKTMRGRMEELGKMPKNETFVSDVRGDTTLVPNPAALDTTFTTTTTSLYSLMKENISPSSILSSIHPPQPPTLPPPPSYPLTPLGKRAELNPAQPSPASYRFSVGLLPNWAKAEAGEAGVCRDDSLEKSQPKGRWAQRFDHNLAFKSQLDLSHLDDTDYEGRMGVGSEGDGLPSLKLTTSMPDLRRETVVFSHQHLPNKNIPIIDDDETNVDDNEDFFPVCMKDSLPQNEADCHPSHDGGQKTQRSDSLSGRSDRVRSRRWSNRLSVGSDDLTYNIDLDDTDDLDPWSDTTNIIYPPSKTSSVDQPDSSYQVFAVDGIKKKIKKRTSSVYTDDDGDSGDLVSIEEQEEDVADEVMSGSSGNTPYDPDGHAFPRTPDKEQFVKENFESVTFSPVSMAKFVQQVSSLEQAADLTADLSSLPFSPRLSLSSKFLSRSHFVGVRSGAGLASRRNADSWFNTRPKSKSHIAHAMADTRKRLSDMNWRTGGLVHESPEKDDSPSPPSPPTRLENKEPSFSTPVTSSHGNLSRELEKNTSPILPSPPHHRLPEIPSQKATPVGRTKRHSGEHVPAQDGKGTTSSQAPSYSRTTKASRMKSTSAGNLLKQAEAPSVRGSSGGEEKKKMGVKKRLLKGRLSSSSQAKYRSTPNLADCVLKVKKEEEEESPPVEGASNLCHLANLSFSEPDIAGLSNPPLSLPPPPGKESKAESMTKTISPRRSLPTCVSKPTTHHPDLTKVAESQLMPPPPVFSLPSRPVHSGLLRRAAQVRKRSASELTLEQAKSILLGNSGVLESQQVSHGTESDENVFNNKTDLSAGYESGEGNSKVTSSIARDSTCLINSQNSSHSAPSSSAQHSTTSSNISSVNGTDIAAKVLLSSQQGKEPISSNKSSVHGAQGTENVMLSHQQTQELLSSKHVNKPDLDDHDVPSSPNTLLCADSAQSLSPASCNHRVSEKSGDGPYELEVVDSISVNDKINTHTHSHARDSHTTTSKTRVRVNASNAESTESTAMPLIKSARKSLPELPVCLSSLKPSQSPHTVSQPDITVSPCSESPLGNLEPDHTKSQFGESYPNDTVSPNSHSPLGESHLDQAKSLYIPSPNDKPQPDHTESLDDGWQSNHTISPNSQSLQTESQPDQAKSPYIQSLYSDPQLNQTKSPYSQPQSDSQSQPDHTKSSFIKSPYSDSQPGQTKSPYIQSPESQSQPDHTKSPYGDCQPDQMMSPCSQSPEQRGSPRSQSDTGVGSDTDTDSDVLQCEVLQGVGVGVGRADRSRLSLPLHSFNAPLSDMESSEDMMTTCSSVVLELKVAVQKAQHFHSQMEQASTGVTSPSHQQVLHKLSETFHEAHLTLAELAHLCPAPVTDQSFWCPLVREKLDDGEKESSVLSQARGMLQPLLSSLSRELTREVVKVVRDKLDDVSPPVSR